MLAGAAPPLKLPGICHTFGAAVRSDVVREVKDGLTRLTVIAVIRWSCTLESPPGIPDHIPDTTPAQIISSLSQRSHSTEIHRRLQPHKDDP